MRGIQLGRVAGRSLLRPSNNSCPYGLRIAAQASIPRNFVRWKSSSNEDETTSTWTPHTLKPSISPITDVLGGLGATKDGLKLHTAYIALGSNLGDRIGWIEKACNEMSARGVKVKRTSSLWETAPMYVLNQEEFINGACEVETSLEPLALLDELQSIENDLGREKIIDKGPRNIDLDILLYDDHVIEHERLSVPHPGMFEREFVLRPLAELIPEQPLHPASPWKLTQDYLNALPPAAVPISTITPLATDHMPIRALQANRQTLVMAILNVTPDSFSDGGVHWSPANSTEPTKKSKESHVSKLYKSYSPLFTSGAEIIDIGGQSTAPNTPEVTAEEELSRVLPAVLLAHENRLQTNNKYVISVDTYRASVAEAALNAGADMINDVSAGTLDEDMLPTVARLGKTISLMHMRGTVRTMNGLTDYTSYGGVVPGVAIELLCRVKAAEEAGIRRWRIILDPGIGFAKTAEQNIELLRGMGELRDWPGLRGLPWLVGSSRKKFIGAVTGKSRAKERDWGTAATVAAAIWGGADIVRIHAVNEMRDVVRMSDAIWRV